MQGKMLLDEINNIAEHYFFKLASLDNIKGLENEIVSYIYNKYGYKIHVEVTLVGTQLNINVGEDLILLDRKLKIEKIKKKINGKGYYL